MPLAQKQAIAAGSPALPKNEEEIKTSIANWLLSHGQVGRIVLLLGVVALVALTQAQNIEAGSRMVGRLLGKRRKPLEPQVAVSSPSFTNLPADRPGFVARSAELQQLAADLAPEAAQVVIHGLPGVGKTTLARHYAHSHGAAYPGGVWWLDASKGFEPMVLEAVTELEARIPGLGKVEGLTLEARLRRCFQAWPGQMSEAVLLVVDNLRPPPEGLEMMHRLMAGLPGRFRRLLTQRSLPPSSTAVLRLPVLAPEEALELLKTRSGERGRERISDDEEQARELVKQVGHLPLAIVLLGGRMERLPSLSVTDLREELKKFALHAKAFSKENADFQGEQGLVATLLTSWAAIGPEAKELARLLSLTLPEPILWKLIELCEIYGAEDNSESHFEDGLAELISANLLEAHEAHRFIYLLHPVVRDFFGHQRQGWAHEHKSKIDLAAAAQALAKECEGRHLFSTVVYLRQACHADPSDAYSALHLGQGFADLGSTKLAMRYFRLSRRNAKILSDPRCSSSALHCMADVQYAQGKAARSLILHKGAFAILEEFANQSPSDIQLQNDLLISNARVGDLLYYYQGDGPGALLAYQASLAIAEDLVKQDPEEIKWRKSLSWISERIGDVLTHSQRDAAGALSAYKAAVAIRENLAKNDPANAQKLDALLSVRVKIGDLLHFSFGDEDGALAFHKAAMHTAEELVRTDPTNARWKRNLSIVQLMVGDVLIAKENFSGAIKCYRESLAIRDLLTKLDPNNSLWQRDLSECNVRIGNALRHKADWHGALASYISGMTIGQDLLPNLANDDPVNMLIQRDLLVIDINAGEVLTEMGDLKAALRSFERGLQIALCLTRLDQENLQWQLDLAKCHERIGDVRKLQEDYIGALAAYKATLTIGSRLAQKDPLNPVFMHSLALCHFSIGDVHMKRGDGSGSLESHQTGLRIIEELARKVPANTQWQVDVAVSCGKLGAMESLLSVAVRREYLRKGLKILQALKQSGRLHSNQDHTAWFESEIQKLDDAR